MANRMEKLYNLGFCELRKKYHDYDSYVGAYYDGASYYLDKYKGSDFLVDLYIYCFDDYKNDYCYIPFTSNEFLISLIKIVCENLTLSLNDVSLYRCGKSYGFGWPIPDDDIDDIKENIKEIVDAIEETLHSDRVNEFFNLNHIGLIMYKK